MLQYDFEKELLEAIEKALAGSGIKPSYVLGFLEPVIEKHIAPNGVGTLVRAAQDVLVFRSRIVLICLPYQACMEGLSFALTDLDAAVRHIHQQGRRSEPSRPENS